MQLGQRRIRRCRSRPLLALLDKISITNPKLYRFLALAEVFETELEGGGAAVVVFYDAVADVDRIAAADVFEAGGHVEADGGNLVVGLRFLDEFELEVLAGGANLAAVAVVVDVFGEEDRGLVAGAEGLELLEDAEELRGYLREVEPRVDVDHRGGHLLGHVAADVFFDAAGEFGKVFLLEGQAGGVDVATEVFQEVGLVLDGVVKVEAADAAGRAGDEAVALCKDERGLVERLDKTGGDDADHALVP